MNKKSIGNAFTPLMSCKSRLVKFYLQDIIKNNERLSRKPIFTIKAVLPAYLTGFDSYVVCGKLTVLFIQLASFPNY